MKNTKPYIFLLFIVALTVSFGATLSPIRKGLDLTGRTNVTGSQLNQIVDSSFFVTPYGFIIRTNVVPDTNTYPILTNCIWIDTRTTPAAICSWQTGSWVSATVSAGSIGTIQLQDLSVTSNKLAEPSVTTPKIKDRSVISSKIDYNAVLGTNIAWNQLINQHYTDGSITDSKLASSAVGTGKIAANVVARSNLQVNLITSNQLDQTAPFLLSNNIAASQVTLDKIDITSSSVGTKGQAPYIDTVTGTVLAWGTPFCLQEIRNSSNALQSVTSTVVFDDTTFGTGEGTKVLEVTITPKRSDTFIVVESLISFGESVSAKIAAGIFRDAGATALSVGYTTTAAANHVGQIKLYTKVASSSTTATTFKILVGVDAGTVYINGQAAARIFGGTSESWITVREVNM